MKIGKKRKRVLCALLTLCMLVTMFAGIPAAGAETADAGVRVTELVEYVGAGLVAYAPAKSGSDNVDYIEVGVSTFEHLDDYLTREGNYHITLTKDISKTFAEVGHDSLQTGCQVATDILTLGLMEILWQDFDAWRPSMEGSAPYQVIKVAKGHKILDLNGHDFFVYNPGLNMERSYLFTVGEGVDFTIMDDTNEGEVFMDGYIFAACDYDYFKYEEMGGHDQQRDLVLVEGGKFTLNGGNLAGGRSKNEDGFVTANTQLKGDGGYDWVSGYTGSATKYVNSTAIRLNSGEVVINRGKVKGRGFEEILNGHQGWDSPNVKNGVIEAKSGKLTINEGHIYATGGSDCLQIANGVEVTINAGKFTLHRNDALFCGRYDGYDSQRIYCIEDEPLFGKIGIPEGAISNPDNTWVEYYTGKGKGKVLAKESEWRTQFKDKVENKHGADDYEPSVVIYPDGGFTTLTAVKSPDTEIPTLDPSVVGQLAFKYDTASKMTFIPEEVRKAAGWERKYEFFIYDWNGEQMKITRSKDSEVSGYKDNYCSTERTWEISPSTYLGDILNKYICLGKTFTVGCIMTEIYHGARDYEIVTIAGRQFKTANLTPVKIYKAPDSTVVVAEKGDTATLTASALYAVNVKWYFKEQSGSSEEISSDYYTINKEEADNKGNVLLESTLTWPVNKNGIVYCVFSNSLGGERCDTKIGYAPSFKNKENSEVTIYKSAGGMISQPIDGTLDDGMYFQWLYWFFNVEDTTVQYTANGNNLKIPAGNDALLNVSSTPDSLGNVYFCEIRQKKDGEDKLIATSPAIKVNYVNDTPPDKAITGLVIKLKDTDMRVGAKAPTKEGAYIAYGAAGMDIETRAYIDSLTVEGSENGIITSSTPTIRMRVKTTSSYFYFQGAQRNKYGETDDYYLPCSIDGFLFYAKMQSGTRDDVDIIIKYDGTDVSPITRVPDTVILNPSEFCFTKGQERRINLQFSLIMSEYAESLGEKHYITKIEAYNVTSDQVSPWPKGLELEYMGKRPNAYGKYEPVYLLKGTIANDVSLGEKKSLFYVYVADNSSDDSNVRRYPVYFTYTVLPEQEKTDEEIHEEVIKEVEEEKVHVHVMGEWKAISVKTNSSYPVYHVRICEYFESDTDEHGNEFDDGGCWYAETEPHTWAEVGIVEEATKEKAGKIKYKCIVCGAEIEKEYELTIENYSVTLDLNMGDKVAFSTTTFNWTEDYYTLPDFSELAHPEGKVFDGWKITANNDPDRTFTQTKAGEKVLVNCDITCTAQWKYGGNYKITFADVNAKTVAAGATIIGVVDGQKAGGNLTFTVKNDRACTVLVSSDGGKTYSRVEAKETIVENAYSFTINVKSNIILAVACKGDISLDGKMDSADALQILRYDVGKYTDVSSMQIEIAKVSNDDKVDSADALQILRADVGKTKFDW